MIQEEDHILVRLAALRLIKKYLDDVDFDWKENPGADDVERLKVYLRKHSIPIPVIPDDKMGKGVIKAMYRAWASIDCLNSMCYLLGEEKE